MDHAHGPEAAMSDEADPLYRPLSGPGQRPVDEGAWDQAVDRLRRARRDDPDWGAMVGRGMLLAAAYRSGAMDGLYALDGDLVRALLLGEAALGSINDTARVHVRANHDALLLARDVEVSQDAIRRIHEVACRPQITHPVRVDGRLQDHVLAAGDYKHHPNHVRDAAGHWRPTAPVAQVESEMATLVAHVRSPGFADLHPVAQAAYLLHALDHVRPFADGNGRVARALAGGCLLRAASIPFLELDDGDVQQAGMELMDVLASADRHRPAVTRWRAEEEAGSAMRRRLAPAVAEALDRYGRRPDRRADLSAAVVVQETVVTIRVPPAHVEEVLAVDAHPEDGDGPVVLSAAEAALRLEVVPGADLNAWLDRVIPILALRVAAELE